MKTSVEYVVPLPERDAYTVVLLTLGCDRFIIFGNKRLNGSDIATTMSFSSSVECIQACYDDNLGCLAVSVVSTNDVFMCEMTNDLSKDWGMVADPSFSLFVLSMRFLIFLKHFKSQFIDNFYI